ncbi:collagen-like protein [Lactiplantibacillus plantarum]|nr:collagen-like protein [Lactiplantibacillus plantarum]
MQKYDDETNYLQYTSNTPTDYMGSWLPFTPTLGQVYTLSADVCGNGYITGGIFHYEGAGNSSLARVDVTDNWQRISNTFSIDKINGNWAIYANNSTLLKVKNIKIEKGPVATDWCLNPTEILTQSDYAKLQAAIVALGGSLK